MNLDIDMLEIMNEKYKEMSIEELWKNFLDVNEDIQGCFENNRFHDFYDILIETLFVTSQIKEKSFFEKESLMMNLKLQKEYEELRGNSKIATSLREQITYLQKLVY